MNPILFGIMLALSLAALLLGIGWGFAWLVSQSIDSAAAKRPADTEPDPAPRIVKRAKFRKRDKR